MIDLHRKRIALLLSVASDGEDGSNAIDYKLETWPTRAQRRKVARYDLGSGAVCRDDIIG
jgi:hypothetical protein